MNREEAWNLLRQYNKESFHLRHALTVEGIMRYFAKELGYADQEEYWGIVGLLHDLDFELYPEAAALMRPSKSVQDMELKSLKKKFKDKHFAAGCSRDVIKQGADILGWPLDELMEKTIAAMRVDEAAINEVCDKL